jgi:hypothetical protein
MPVSPTDRFLVPDDVMVRAIGDESVLLNLGTETYFGLNTTGSRMWQLLAASASVAEAVDALAVEFDVDREELMTDLCSLADELVMKGLLRVAP